MQPFAAFAKLSLSAMTGILALTLITACGSEEPKSDPDSTAIYLKTNGAEKFLIEDGWVRPASGKMSAAYFTLTNLGQDDNALVSLSSSKAKAVEIHMSEMKDGKSTMRQIQQLPVAAGESALLAPGGLHIMLMGLEAPLAEGDAVDFTALFENGETYQFQLPVRAATSP